MSRQLDILALEPFFGGPRKAMLETLARFSRHRWTVMKLPPRRVERRLTAAASWFAEQISRNPAGRFDLLFTSEMLNLSSFYRLVPVLARIPSVVYFHSNQLPTTTAKVAPADLANLNTAAAATEIWFNSRYHAKVFFGRVQGLIERHAELSSMNPLPQLKEKARLIAPPVDFESIDRVRRESGEVRRNARTILIDTRDANVSLLNTALGMVDARGYSFELLTIGPADGISEDFKRQSLPEHDDNAHARAMLQAGVVLSARVGATTDFVVTRAIGAGCRPVLPASGVYQEIIPEAMQSACLYEPQPDALSTRLQVALVPEIISRQDTLRKALAQFDPIQNCKAIDERLEAIASPVSPRIAATV